jgi:hypothetical protein
MQNIFNSSNEESITHKTVRFAEARLRYMQTALNRIRQTEIQNGFVFSLLGFSVYLSQYQLILNDSPHAKKTPVQEKVINRM